MSPHFFVLVPFAVSVRRPLSRYGRDVLCVWDALDESTNVYLDAAVSVAKALAIDNVEQLK